jgi:hypothetical protein
MSYRCIFFNDAYKHETRSLWDRDIEIRNEHA